MTEEEREERAEAVFDALIDWGTKWLVVGVLALAAIAGVVQGLRALGVIA